MNLNFNIPGVNELVDAVRTLGTRLGSASKTSVNQAKAGPSMEDIAAAQGSKIAEELRQARILQAQGIKGFDGVPIGSIIRNLSGQLSGLKKSFPSAFSDPANSGGQGGGGNRGTSIGAMARILGAGIRFASNQAPYQFGSLISIFGSSGPVGMAVGAFVAAIGLMTAGLLSGTKSLNEYADNRTSALATNEETAILKAIGRAIGVDHSELAKVAGSRPGGAQQFLDELRSVLNTQDARSRQRLIQDLGMPAGVERLKKFTPEELSEILSGKGFERDEDDLTRAARREKTFGKLSEAWERFKEGFSGAWGDIFDPNTSMLDKVLKSPVMEGLAGMFGRGFDGIKPAGVGNKTESKMDKAADKLLEAANKTSLAMDAFSWTNKAGVFGGIDPSRASNAYPSNWAWSWDQLRRKNQEDIMYMGAFTL